MERKPSAKSKQDQQRTLGKEIIMNDKPENKPAIKPRTDSELRKLALDIVENKVCGSWQLVQDDPSMIPSVFMPLALGGTVPEDAIHVYEYLNKAGPMAVNDWPIFMSCRFILEDENERLKPMIEELEDRKKEFLDRDEQE